MRRVAAAGALLALALVLAQPARDALLRDSPPTPLASAAGAEGLAGSVLAGSFRPLLVTYLWLRADVLYGEGRDEECVEVYRLLHRLYPQNARAREFLGWFLAFNLKRKAPDPALGWQWAEAGLDMLLPLPDGPRVVADWIRTQCGQNSLVLVRYAGPAWAVERVYRERLRDYGRRRFGDELSRFALGVRVLEGRGGMRDRIRRGMLLMDLAYEELLRYGDAPHAAEAVEALRGIAREIENDDELRSRFEDLARCLDAAAAGRVPESRPGAQAYRVAMAFLGRGAAKRDAEALAKSEALLDSLGADDLREEIDLVRRWRVHVGSPGGSERPPLPFDGLR